MCEVTSASYLKILLRYLPLCPGVTTARASENSKNSEKGQYSIKFMINISYKLFFLNYVQNMKHTNGHNTDISTGHRGLYWPWDNVKDNGGRGDYEAHYTSHVPHYTAQ